MGSQREGGREAEASLSFFPFPFFLGGIGYEKVFVQSMLTASPRTWIKRDETPKFGKLL